MLTLTIIDLDAYASVFQKKYNLEGEGPIGNASVSTVHPLDTYIYLEVATERRACHLPGDAVDACLIYFTLW